MKRKGRPVQLALLDEAQHARNPGLSVFLGFGGAPHPLDSLNAQTVFGRDMEYR